MTIGMDYPAAQPRPSKKAPLKGASLNKKGDFVTIQHRIMASL